jgi:hypothetical protein
VDAVQLHQTILDLPVNRTADVVGSAGEIRQNGWVKRQSAALRVDLEVRQPSVPCRQKSARASSQTGRSDEDPQHT